MKKIDPAKIDRLPGQRLSPGETFRFSCHPGIGCFNRCCRNLNLFLYPYDVIRLKNRLEISASRFLEEYVDVVLRKGNHFPDVLLRMADDAEQSCTFLTDKGCSVYEDRPDTCRTFPVEQGLVYGGEGTEPDPVHFFRPPDFCLGKNEEKAYTLETWADDQEAGLYNRMTAEWARIRSLFLNDPWGIEGPEGPRAKMAFMAAYNIDAFREFVFGSSFLKRFKVKKDLQRKFRRSDVELLKLGFEWIRFTLWKMDSDYFKPR